MLKRLNIVGGIDDQYFEIISKKLNDKISYNFYVHSKREFRREEAYWYNESLDKIVSQIFWYVIEIPTINQHEESSIYGDELNILENAYNDLIKKESRIKKLNKINEVN